MRFEISSGDGEFVEDAGDDLFGVEAFGFGFVGDGDAVAEDFRSDGFHVVGGDVGAAVEEGVGAGCEGEVDGGARGGADPDERGDVDAEVVGAAGWCGRAGRCSV